jgi:hypothetical protein
MLQKGLCNLKLASVVGGIILRLIHFSLRQNVVWRCNLTTHPLFPTSKRVVWGGNLRSRAKFLTVWHPGACLGRLAAWAPCLETVG